MYSLNEASLGRIYQHIQKKNIQSWSILTSFRDELKPSENNKRFYQLKNRIRQMNLGFIQMEGVGQEEINGEIVNVKEPSLFIPDITLKQAQKLSDEYDQWGIIYSGPENEHKITLYSKQGQESIGSFHPNKIAKFFSKIKGKPFTFESIKPSTFMERYHKYLTSKE